MFIPCRREAGAGEDDLETRVLILARSPQDLVSFRDKLRSRGLQVELASGGQLAPPLVPGGIWQVVLVDLRPTPRDALEHHRSLLERLAACECHVVGLAPDAALIEGSSAAELGLDAVVLRDSDPDLLASRLMMLGIDELRDAAGASGLLDDRLDRALAGPLAVASSVAYVLERHSDTLSERELAVLARELDLEGDRVGGILADLEALEAIRSGVARKSYEAATITVDVAALARELAQGSRARSEAPRRLMVVAPDYPVRVTGHQDYLRGLISRLVAAAFEDSGGGPQEVEIRLEPSHERISISMMADPEQPGALDWRDQSPHIGLRPGRDLSLAVVRGYADLHGGSLRVVGGPDAKKSYLLVLPG